MARRVLYAYVFPYMGRPRRVVFCSQDCGNAALEEPPGSWNCFRAQVSHALRDAIACTWCGRTIAQANEDAVAQDRRRAVQRSAR